MHPELIRIGPLTLYSFGLLLLIGFLSGIYLAEKLARRQGLPAWVFADGAFLMLIGGLAGARLVFVLLNWGSYQSDPLSMVQTWRGGMSFHGGVVGGVAAGWIYLRARRLPFLPFADAAAPGMALAYAIGRIGCLMNGCCYGRPTDLPWGIIFPQTGTGLPHHPVQIYAALINLGLAGLLALALYRPHHPGQIIALYAGSYSLYRFLVEFLRSGVTAQVMALGLTEAQWFSLLAMAASMVWWRWLGRRSREAARQPAGPDSGELPLAGAAK